MEKYLRQSYFRMFAVIIAVVVIALYAPRTVFASPSAADTEGDYVADLTASPRTPILLAPNLWLGLKPELKVKVKRDLDLDSNLRDNLLEFEPELGISLSYKPSETVRFFLYFKLDQILADDDRHKKKNFTEFELRELYISFDRIAEGLSARIGRQRFTDSRKWLYDDYLDAARVFYKHSNLSLEFSASQRNDQELFHGDDHDKVNNYAVYGTYALNHANAVSAYVFAQHDRTDAHENPIFFGLHANGKMMPGLAYWMELAHARGNSGSNKIRAFGLDIGSTYELPLPLRPSVTAGYAVGTGDKNPSDGTDRNFRQSNLFQDKNEAIFNGVARVKYYGVALDPDLSNIGIITAGIGVRPLPDASLDLVYHNYRQQDAASVILNSNITKRPDGLNKDLGQEVDLVAGYAGKHWKGRLEIGYFMPGDAFPHGADNAVFAELRVQYEF